MQRQPVILDPASKGWRIWAGLAALMLALALVIGLPGCKKKRKPGAVTCKLPGVMLTKLKATKSVFDLESKTKTRWMKAIRDGCKPWPRYIRQAMDVAIPPPPRGPVKLSATPIWALPEYKKAEKRLCPGFEKVRGPPPLERKRRKKLIRQYWDRCGLAKLGLMDRDEFEENGALAFSAMAMHRILVRGGLGSAVARKMVRLFLFDNPHLRRVKAAKIQLPKSRSTTMMADAVDLVINHEGVQCRGAPVVTVKGWKVDPNSKRDGPDGFFIDPLFKKLEDEARKLKAAEKQGGRAFRGDALVIVDGRSGYRLLAEVLYTALQAGFKKAQLSVLGPDGKPRVVVVHELRLSMVRANAPKPRFPPPELWIAPKEYVIRFGPTAPATRWPKAQGKATALKKLTAFLRSRLAKLKSIKLPDRVWGRILVNVDQETPVAELIGILDAIREAQPTPPGCYFRYSKVLGGWTVPQRARKACLYPKPILQLGGSEAPPSSPSR